MKNNMRIAFFADNFYPELSGISDSILITGSELARRGHKVEFFVPKYPERAYKISGVVEKELSGRERKSLKIHRMFSLPFPAPTMQGRAALPNLLRGAFAKNKFDIVHSHSFFGPGLDALYLAKAGRVPFVGTNHTLIEAFLSYSPLPEKWIKKSVVKYITWYYNKCNLASAPSRFLLDHMQSNGFTGKGEVVSNPVENAFFSASASKNELKKIFNLPEFTILYAGRISEEKNCRHLFNVYAEFAKKYPNSVLLFVGQGALRKELENQVAQRGLSNQIRFCGPYLGKNKKSLYDIFHAADIFCMPSASETQSMTTLQAMACGLPIVAAKTGPLIDLVGSERGILFELNNLDSFYECFERLYSDYSLREKLGSNSRSFAEQFSAAAIADIWEELYYNLTDNKTK